MAQSDTKVRQMMTGEGTSKSRKYMALVIGKIGWGALIKYELIVLLCSWLPGALGLMLRGKLYPFLLGGVGRGVVFGSNVVLRHPHKIFIGDNVVIDDNCMLDAKGSDNEGIHIGSRVFLGRNSILSCKDGDIRLEDDVNIGFNAEIFSASSVVVGASTMIAAYCYLVGGGNYDIENHQVPFAEQSGFSKGGIEVGGNSWIAAGVTVVDGVRIGAGCVVGAGAVVIDELPPLSVAGGIPAKVLRSRAPESPDESRDSKSDGGRL